jgi:hypothetical protein
MRPPRFRLRTLLIAVAVVATVMGLQRRRADFLGRAEQHGRMELHRHAQARGLGGAILPRPMFEALMDSDDLRSGCGWANYRGVRFEGKERLSTLGAALEQMAAHHAALRRKYERAARYPWLPVAPDPPPP